MKTDLRSISIMIITILFAFSTNGQDKPVDDDVKFYDIIKDDSVVMYYNQGYRYTGKKCALYRRYTHVDKDANFTGNFIDLDSSNVLIARGNYDSTMMNGLFEGFYKNGNTRFKGLCKDGQPVGDWNYYYPNGKPERTVRFIDGDELLYEFYDEQGNQLIKEGNGYFNAIVAAGNLEVIVASGKLLNGVQDSIWNYTYYSPYATERFNQGKFMYGDEPKSKFLNNAATHYTNQSIFSSFSTGQYFKKLELFDVSMCPEDFLAKNKIKINRSFDIENFKSFAVDAINRVMEQDSRNGNIRDYITGENKFVMSFTVNEKGVPENFKRITGWGDQFFNPVSTALSMHAKLPTSSEKRYFILTVDFNPNNNTTGYGYRFSYDQN